MTVLVAYGSKCGGTQGIAEWIGAALRDLGHDVRVEPARGVRTLEGVEAAIVAGALYAGRWHNHARRFVRRHSAGLAKLPVWLVASGPRSDAADAGTVPPVRQVSAAAAGIGARGEVTFGGYQGADAHGSPPSAKALARAGDWRNEERIRAWAGQVHRELAG